MIQSLETNQVKKLRYFMLFCSISIYLTSLFLVPLSVIEDGQESTSGIGVMFLLTGWMGGPAIIHWLANPFLYLSWRALIVRSRSSLWLSLIALIFSSSLLLIKEIALNEGGIPQKIVSFKVGYYLWLGSILVLFVATILIRIIEKRLPFVHPYGLD